MGIIGSVASAISGDKKNNTAKCCLAEIDQNGSSVKKPVIAFQYFPETISDTRGVDLAQKDVAGGSHPIYQWTHGSDRRVSFDAIFTADLDRDSKDPLSAIKNTIGVLKNPGAALTSTLTSKSAKNNPFDQDIRAYLAWLRAKTYPLYQKSNAVQPPPILLLYVQGSGITSFVTSAWPVDVLTCVMTSCNITYESFFRSGMPRSVTVSLEFTEVIQVGKNWKFANRSDFDKYWKNSKMQLPTGPEPVSSARSGLAGAASSAIGIIKGD